MIISDKFNFGNNKEIAEKLKQLVLSGKKTATMGLHKERQKNPSIGDYGEILDSNNKRICIIQYTNIEVKLFLEVKYDFIRKEGEGDKDVEQWREKHRKFFNLENDNVKVICEEFEVIVNEYKMNSKKCHGE